MLFLAAIFKTETHKNQMGLGQFKISRFNNQNIQVSSSQKFVTKIEKSLSKKAGLGNSILQAEVSQS